MVPAECATVCFEAVASLWRLSMRVALQLASSVFRSAVCNG